MAAPETRSQRLLAQVAVGVIVLLIGLGIIWYGVSTEVNQRIWRDMVERPGGPMTFRFILQPLMAAIAALHDARVDARTGRSLYLWTLLTNPDKRAGRLREGVIATSRIILLGLGMDLIYQVSVLKTFYPGEAVIIALLLAFIPYVLLRGPFTRLVRWWNSRSASNPTL